MYVKRIEDGGMIVIVVWVDDLIIAASNETLLTDVKDMLKCKFRMKVWGDFSLPRH